MRLNPIGPLVLLNLALGGGAASLWVDTSGQPINQTWRVPAPVVPNIQSPQPLGAGGQPGEANPFAAILERPVFAPDRKPPPPPPPPAPPAPPPPPDPLENAQLLGVFTGDLAGVLVRAEGKVRRVSVNEALGQWTLKGVEDRNVTFTRGGESRVVRLVSLRPSAPRPESGAAPVSTPSGPAQVVTAESQEQERVERERDRLRRRNEIRAKAGLPPVTE